MDEFHFSGDGLVGLSRDLLGAAAALRLAAPRTLTLIGHTVGADAARIAASNGSTSIPGTIRGNMVGALEYRIRAGSEDVPIASLWELGNKGSRRRTQFKHPVFGRPNSDVWQPMHPFLRPALNENRAFITQTMERMWDHVLTPWRLRPENFGLDAGPVESFAVSSVMGVASGL